MFLFFLLQACSLPDQSTFQKGNGNLYEEGTDQTGENGEPSSSDTGLMDSGFVEPSSEDTFESDTSGEPSDPDTGLSDSGFEEPSSDDTFDPEPSTEDTNSEDTGTTDTGDEEN